VNKEGTTIDFLEKASTGIARLYPAFLDFNSS